MKKEYIINIIKQMWNRTSVQSALINLLVLLVVVLIAEPHYAFDMDVMMQAQLFNISGTWSTGMLLFSNVYLGRFLKVLCGMPGHFNWYTIFQYAIIYLALWKIGERFLRTNKSRISHVMYAIFNAFVGYECYINISYMKSAALLCLSAIYVLYRNMMERRQEGEGLSYIYAGWAIVVGGLISWKAVLISGGEGLICALALLTINKSLVTRNRRKALLTIIGASLLIGLFQMGDYMTYENTAEWARVIQYRDALEDIEMFGVQSYQAEMVETAQLTEDEYRILVDGKYISFDDNAFEKINNLAKMKQSITGQTIVDFLRKVPRNLFSVGMFYGNAILWILLVFSKNGRKKICLAATSGIVGITYMIMYFVASCNTSIVHFLILLPAMGIPLCSATDMYVTKDERRSTIAFLLMACVLFYQKFGASMMTSVKTEEVESQLMEDIDNLEQPWHVICLNDYLKSFSVFLRYDEGLIAGKNLVVLDGAYTLIPLYNGVVYPAGWSVEQATDAVNTEQNIVVWMYVI